MTKDDMIKEAMRICVAIEELVEEIDAAPTEVFTAFDVKRTTLDLRVAARLTATVAEKLKQVGTWKKP